MIGKKIRKKLSSSSGASLSIALLLFLVCAVLGSVILKSGTAASGRVADLAKSDARYYSVTSAADLLADVMTKTSDGKDRVVTIEKTRTTTSTQTLQEGSEDWEDKADKDPNYTLTIKEDQTGGPETILIKAVEDIFFNGNTFPDDCWDKDTPSVKNEYGEDSSRKSSFSLNFTGNPEGDLTVYVNETILSNGDIELTVSNVNSDTAEGFRVKMLFALTSKTQQTSSSRTTYKQNYNAEGEVSSTDKITTRNEKKTTKCYWTLTEIRKVN